MPNLALHRDRLSRMNSRNFAASAPERFCASEAPSNVSMGTSHPSVVMGYPLKICIIGGRSFSVAKFERNVISDDDSTDPSACGAPGSSTAPGTGETLVARVGGEAIGGC